MGLMGSNYTPEGQKRQLLGWLVLSAIATFYAGVRYLIRAALKKRS